VYSRLTHTTIDIQLSVLPLVLFSWYRLVYLSSLNLESQQTHASYFSSPLDRNKISPRRREITTPSLPLDLISANTQCFHRHRKTKMSRRYCKYVGEVVFGESI
jgi:hypothetical protein